MSAIITSAVLIFVLRLINMTLATMRLVLTVRGRKWVAAIVGFFESFIFVFAIARVVQDLNNIFNMIGYAGGFASGILVGLALERRLAIGFGHVRIISSQRGSEVAAALRKAGYGATELVGRGREGHVSVISSTVRRRDITNVDAVAIAADPACFVTVDEVRPLRRGFWRA